MTTPVLEELRKRATAAEFILIETAVTEVQGELQANKIRAEVRAEIVAELRQMAEAIQADRGYGGHRDPTAALGAAVHRFLKANPKKP